MAEETEENGEQNGQDRRQSKVTPIDDTNCKRGVHMSNLP